MNPGPAGRAGTAVKAAAHGFASWRDHTNADPRHDERTAALLGSVLGLCFSICFVTGVYSHLAQDPPDWFILPARPAGLYRFTQGLHVTTGIATIPLLFAKLWAVFPRLFTWPPARNVAHAIERLSLVVLVGGSFFMLISGVANIDLWYYVPINFRSGHYWMAWMTIGALIIHVGAKFTITRRELLPRRERPETGPSYPSGVVDPSARRRFLTLVGGGAGLITLVSVGQTVGPLRKLALLAPRRPDVGTTGDVHQFPVNGTAAEARVTMTAADPAWRLRVVGNIAHPLELSLDDLRAMPQRVAELPISCVEGWSASRHWGGVALVDLLSRAGAAPDASVSVQSLQTGSPFDHADINHVQAHDPDTLLALDADGQVLSLDHGFPLRLIGPNRPGVMQTKWLALVTVY